MALYGYGIADGWNVALLSIVNIEDQLDPYVKPRVLAPRSQPREAHPVRETALSGRVRGDGLSVVQWGFRAMPVLAFKYLWDTYYSSGAVVSPQLTLLHRRHVAGDYERLNVYGIRPIAGQEFTYKDQLCLDVIFKFNVIEVL